jgi:hypothetical protein
VLTARAFRDVATVPTVSQRGLFSLVIGIEYEDGWDAALRLATQKDGIVGSTVGRKVGHGRRDPDNATTRVKASPNNTSGSCPTWLCRRQGGHLIENSRMVRVTQGGR